MSLPNEVNIGLEEIEQPDYMCEDCFNVFFSMEEEPKCPNCGSFNNKLLDKLH